LFIKKQFHKNMTTDNTRTGHDKASLALTVATIKKEKREKKTTVAKPAELLSLSNISKMMRYDVKLKRRQLGNLLPLWSAQHKGTL